jgi:Holliday junction resolvase RusA-like endonuclease
MRLHFEVPGAPVTKGRPRFGKGRTYTPKATVDYERKVGLCARTAAVFARVAQLPPFSGEVSASLAFYMPTARRLDIDNLCKAVLDGCNGILWADDSQVAMLFAARRLDRANPRVVVTIEALGGAAS